MYVLYIVTVVVSCVVFQGYMAYIITRLDSQEKQIGDLKDDLRRLV